MKRPYKVTAASVLRTFDAHPDWNSEVIARELGLDSSYVRKTLAAHGRKLRKIRMPPHPARNGLTANVLRELFHYDPETGLFTRQVATGRHGCWGVGSIAGSPHIQGYVQIGIGKSDYLAHRLAWLYMTGEWPPVEIDHRDGNRSNNRWSNLREATSSQNSANQRRSTRNTSGIKGVGWDRARGRWRAQHAGCFIGRFDTAEEAREAYARAASERFGEYARLS